MILQSSANRSRLRRWNVWLISTLFIIHCSLSIKTNAQPPSSATLADYVREGLANNLALKQESLEISRVTENLAQAKALFYPRLAFAPTYSLAAGGRRLDFPVGDLLNPAYTTLNKLTNSNNFPTNIENVNQLLAPNNFHDTKFSFSYSIYNTDIQYNYLIQKELLSTQQARRRVVENELRYNIEGAYYQYLQTLDAIRIYENSRRVLGELVRLNQKLVANNVATKDVVSTAEYEVSKLNQQVAIAEKNRETARAYFNFLLNRDLGTVILVDSVLIKNSLPTPTENLLGLEETAIGHRQEIEQLGGSLRAAQTAVKLNEANAMKPNVFVGGNAGFQGFGYKFSNQAYMVAQLGLQWDIFKGYEKRSKIQQAKIQTDVLKTRLQELQQQIRLQVVQAYYDLDAAKETVTTTAQGVTATSQTLRVIDSKYRNGQSLLIELIKAQNDNITAQIQQSLARFDVLMKQAALNRVVAVSPHP
jgi:outer membrane protein